MIWAFNSRLGIGRKNFPRVRGAVVLFRNLAGIPFASSVFFSSLWQEEVRETIRGLAKLPNQRENEDGNHPPLVFLLQVLSGETVFLKKKGILWQGMLINGYEHIQTFAEGPTWRVNNLWEMVDFWDDEVEKGVDYAYDPKWGYLTASPLLLGTACKAYLWMHLPVLSFLYGEERLLQWFRDSGNFEVRGLGRDGAIYAHVFEVSNRFTLGVSEQDILAAIGVLGFRTLRWEKQARLNFDRFSFRKGDFEKHLEHISQEILPQDDKMEKGIFDFLSLWLWGQEEGIIKRKEGFKYIEEGFMRDWLLGDMVRRNVAEALKIIGVWPRRIFQYV